MKLIVSVLKHGDESSGRLKMRLKERFIGFKFSWIYFRYTLGEFGGQNPTIGEGSERIGRSLNRLDSKFEEKLKITWNHE